MGSGFSKRQAIQARPKVLLLDGSIIVLIIFGIILFSKWKENLDENGEDKNKKGRTTSGIMVAISSLFILLLLYPCFKGKKSGAVECNTLSPFSPVHYNVYKYLFE